MVDNDLFSQLDPRWKKAARATFNTELTDHAVDLAVQAASSSLRESGCDALLELLSLASSLECPETKLSHFNVAKSLREIERRHRDRPTSVACDVLRKLIESSTRDDDVVKCAAAPRIFIRDVVIDFILQSVLPAGVIDRLLQSPDWTANTIYEHRQNLQNELRRSARLKKLVDELVVDPSGATITLLRVSSPKSPLLELLNHPLTA